MNTVCRERFNPVPLGMLIEVLAAHLHGRPEQKAFLDLAWGLNLIYDVHFSQRLERLKRLYFPFDPGRALEHPGSEETKAELFREVAALLERANFSPLDRAAIEAALNKTSPRGVVVSVDLSEFQEILIYYRGSAILPEELPWWKKRLGRKSRDIPVYRRLFIVLQLKPDPGHQDPQPVYIKLFRDIPHSDLETIFPNTRIRLRLIDKAKLAVTGGGGAVGGFMSAAGKLTAATNPTAVLGAVAAIVGVLWKQIANVIGQRTRYMAQLARNLYFYNLDNDVGALAWLVESASSEEVKEALLAYHMLWEKGAMTRYVLDREVELFMEKHFGVTMDFEVSDGLDKLDELGLLQRDGKGLLSVIPLRQANLVLQQRWNALYPAATAEISASISPPPDSSAASSR